MTDSFMSDSNPDLNQHKKKQKKRKVQHYDEEVSNTLKHLSPDSGQSTEKKKTKKRHIHDALDSEAGSKYSDSKHGDHDIEMLTLCSSDSFTIPKKKKKNKRCITEEPNDTSDSEGFSKCSDNDIEMLTNNSSECTIPKKKKKKHREDKPNYTSECHSLKKKKKKRHGENGTNIASTSSSISSTLPEAMESKGHEGETEAGAQKGRKRKLETGEKRDFERTGMEDIESLVHPHTLSLNTLKNVQHREELLRMGIKLKAGKWSTDENLQLEYNFDKFVKEHNIEDAYQLLSVKENGERKQLLRFLLNNQFYQRLAYGILRTTYSCYKRARTLFHPDSSAKLDEDEIRELGKLREKYGNKWSKIGEALGKYGQTLNDYSRYHMTGQQTDKGVWTEEEQQQLISAIKEELGTDDLSNMFHELPYAKLAEKVPTRNGAQCRQQWLKVLCLKTAHEEKSPSWTKQDKIKLIKCIYKMDVEGETDIDWDQVYTKFDSVASPQALQIKWYELKTSVPDFNLKTFDTICEHLVSRKIPVLER